MVTEYGFSDSLGDVDFASRYKSLSAETKEKIEGEVRRIIEEGRARATKLLTERRKELELLANALVEYEVLNLEEMQKVLKGEKLPKLEAEPSAPLKLPELQLPPSMGNEGVEQ
jgi:ATP-dependent metalloprotease